MKTIRFQISDETNKKLMKIKGGSLKLNYAQLLFEQAVSEQYKKCEQRNK